LVFFFFFMLGSAVSHQSPETTFPFFCSPPRSRSFSFLAVVVVVVDSVVWLRGCFRVSPPRGALLSGETLRDL